MLGHSNVNFLRNTFESVADVIQGTFEIFLLPETKFNESLPDKQFYLNNLKIGRKDRKRFWGGIMVYVNGNLPYKCLIPKVDNETETIFLEVNFQSSKWLFVGL